MKRIRCGMIFLLAAALLTGNGSALAQQAGSQAAFADVLLTPVAAQNEYGSVTYPELTGYSETSVQESINRDIFDRAQIESHLATLEGLAAGGWGLTVDYRATLQSGVLSVVVSAYGEMPSGRMGQTYDAVNYNLFTGKPIAAEDLFADVEGAFALMEQKLEDEVRPQLSGYLENDALTPVPRDNFFLTPDGITFYYPQDQFSMLSGYSGGCTFSYYELADYLLLAEGSVLNSLGAGDFLSISAASAGRIGEAAAAGQMPGIDARLGDNLPDLLNKYRLLVEPDYFPGGRFFEVEAPEFRSVWLFTDALTESYDHSQVLGIRADRINLYGIRPGITTLAEWRAALGEPETTAVLDESTAEDYRLPAGTSDYYLFGENKLRLHADEQGVLQSVQLLR